METTPRTMMRATDVDVQELDLNSSFDNLLERADDIQSDCYDYVVKGNELTYNSVNTLLIPDNVKPVEGTGGDHEVHLSALSFGQLGNKLNIPTRYMHRCIDEGAYDLLNDNVNYWLNNYDGKLLLRMNGDKVRGILSRKYTSFDTPEILSTIKENIDLSGYSLKGSYLDDERLHLRLVGNNNLHTDDNENDLFPAIFIDSSDVGRCALRVVFGIYKQVCTNGLVIRKFGGTIFSQKHIGIRREDLEESLITSVSRIDNLSRSAERIISDAKIRNIDYKDEKFNEWLKDTTKLSDSAITRTIGLMDARYGGTRWGLINALTEIAQDYTLEQRVNIEEMAGDMLIAA